MIFADFDRRDVVKGTIVLGGAVLLGLIVPVYVAALGDSTGKLLTLPAIIVLATVFVHSRIALLFLMVAVRASVEVPLDARFSLGGADIGLGGLMNGFVIVIAAMLAFEHRGRLRPLLLAIWGPFLAVAVIGSTFSPDRSAAIRLCLQFMADFAVFVSAYLFVDSQKQFRAAIHLAILSSIIPSAYGLFEYLTNNAAYYADAGIRVKGTFSHPNVFAFYLLLAISWILYILKTRVAPPSLIARIAATVYLFVLFALLVLTKGRSAWVACAFLFVAYGTFFERRYLIYLFILGFFALSLPEVRERLSDITLGGNAITTTTATNSFDWRRHLWESALTWMTPSHYLLGYGPESFPFYAPTFFKEGDEIHWDAHNDYVGLFFEIGAVGIAAFLWLYLRALWALRPLARVDRVGAFVLSMLILQYLLVSASDNMVHYLTFNWYFWFGIGAALGLVRRKGPLPQPVDHSKVVKYAEPSPAPVMQQGWA